MALPDPVTDPEYYDGLPLKRAVAFVLDFIAILILTAVAGTILTLMTFGFFAFVLIPFFFLAGFGYRWLTISARSATPGMHFLGIEFRGPAGRLLSRGEAAAHSAIFVGLTATGIGWVATALSVMGSAGHKSLPDHFLGTVAINRPEG